MRANQARINGVLESARRSSIEGFRSRVAEMAVQDMKKVNMPAVRINAGRTMVKFRKKQEEAENLKNRLKCINATDYIQRATLQQGASPSRAPSYIYEPASATFPFRKESVPHKEMHKNFFAQERSRRPQSLAMAQTTLDFPRTIIKGAEWSNNSPLSNVKNGNAKLNEFNLLHNTPTNV